MVIEFIRKKSFEGGAGTFQGIFEKYLKKKSHTLTYYKDRRRPDICFVISGNVNLTENPTL